jgi:hypothetical protein
VRSVYACGSRALDPFLKISCRIPKILDILPHDLEISRIPAGPG